MKRKLLILLITLLMPLFTLSSEEVITNEEAKIETIQTFMEVYKMQNTYSEHSTVKVTIYYYPLTKQARIIYDDDFEAFDYADAIVSLKRCLEEFTKQIGCYHYERYRDDEERNFKFNNKKYTRIISFVIFSK
jgi:hypothetical protein